MSNICNLLTGAAIKMNNIPGEPSVGVVVATGLVLVFSVLVVLWLFFTVSGKVFSAADARKKKQNTQASASAVSNSAPSGEAAAAVKAIYIEQGIPNEVIAVITAAIAAVSGTDRFTLRALTRAKTDRMAWKNAGTRTDTEPF